MENKISDIEGRLKRREEELIHALEESKIIANMERMRLQSIHEQELREKDEQLLNFQRELEQLLSPLGYIQ